MRLMIAFLVILISLSELRALPPWVKLKDPSDEFGQIYKSHACLGAGR